MEGTRDADGQSPSGDRNSEAGAIRGLTLRENYLSVEEERIAVEALNARPWDRVRRGLVQNYGYVFDYTVSSVRDLTRVTPIPAFIAHLGSRLVSDGFFPRRPECIIVNHYEPGEGIVPHIDVIEHFGPQVVTLSLLSSICMVFINDRRRERRLEIALPARSLLAIDGEARFEWLHGIRERKTDTLAGVVVKREQRISISFRNIKDDLRSHSDAEIFAGA